MEKKETKKSVVESDEVNAIVVCSNRHQNCVQDEVIPPKRSNRRQEKEKKEVIFPNNYKYCAV